ncbi:unnamed protein product [Cyclocybe aegerita]|uniref:Uncharacterized protein n=1 Tax=Cyclocybe aegerita TaxID=1973307 RepID=A0A8S0W610_CYCAE|nr:unnamed protein product [Cyclocybe aegerita]
MSTHNSVFVPSPRWLSESPARQPSNTGTPYISYPGLQQNPRSPAPENLYRGDSAAFNVDAGAPYLGVASPAALQDAERQLEEAPRQTRSERLVSGVKQAVRKSLRESQRPSDLRYEHGVYGVPSIPSVIRDSGYASSSSSQRDVPRAAQLDSPRSSPRQATSPRPPSETLVGHYEPKQPRVDQRMDPVMPTDIVPPEAMGSPVSLDPEFGSDYAQMEPPTPPRSDISLNTYLTRIRQFIHDVSALPWIGKDRVTADYYPERRREEERRHPLISWHSHNYSRVNYHLSFANSRASEDASSFSSDSALKAPNQGTPAVLDLEAEFLSSPSSTHPEASPSSRRSRLRAPSGPPGLMYNTPRKQRTPSLYFEPIPADPVPWEGGEEGPPGDGEMWEAFAPTQTATMTPYHAPRVQTPYAPRQELYFTPVQSRTQTPTGEWQAYPRYMDGYVAPQFAENHYGSQYGPGIHSARPPLAPLTSGPPSTASLRRHPSQ